jgi:hypothetical protein
MAYWDLQNEEEYTAACDGFLKLRLTENWRAFAAMVYAYIGESDKAFAA